MKKLTVTLAATTALAALPGLAFAQETAAETPDITPYIFTTLLFLIGGFLVFWMAAAALPCSKQAWCAPKT